MKDERSEDMGAQRTAADGTTSPVAERGPLGRSPLPVTDEDRLAAWREFYPGWRDPLPKGHPNFEVQYDQITLNALQRVLEADRRRVAESEPVRARIRGGE